jgi:hypothetical protein
MSKYVNLETPEMRDIIETARLDSSKRIARELKKDGYTCDKIMQYKDLSEKEIDNL